MKIDWKVLWTQIKAWFLALAANMWEDYLKDEVRNQIDMLITRGTNLINAYHNSEDYKKKKEILLDFIFKNIKLPLFFKPFKNIARSILSNFIEEQVERALKALEELNRGV